MPVSRIIDSWDQVEWRNDSWVEVDDGQEASPASLLKVTKNGRALVASTAQAT